MDKTNIIQLWIRKLQWTLTNEPDHVQDLLRADLHLDFIDFRNPRADFIDPVHDHFPIDHDFDHDLDPVDDFHDPDHDLTHDLDHDHHFDDDIPIHDLDDHLHIDLIIAYPNHDHDRIHHEQDPEVHDDFLKWIANIPDLEVRDDLQDDILPEARADLTLKRKQQEVHHQDIAKTKVVSTVEKKTIFRKIAQDARKSHIPQENFPTSQMKTTLISYLLCKICR